MATAPERTPLQVGVAQNNADSFARLQSLILPETWELNRWMLASLLAINSAAAVAVYSAQGVTIQTKFAVCWFFISGALAALGSGFALSFVLSALDRTVTSAQQYWAAVASGAERSEDEERRHADGALTGFGFLPQVLLFVSTLLFLGGIVQL